MNILLFDFDDTLISYAASEQFGLTGALEEYGISPEPRLFEIYRRENRTLWRLIETGEISSAELRIRRFELLLEKGGIVTDVPAAELSKTYLHYFSQSTQLEAGAREMLEYLHGFPHIRKAIITNGFKDTQHQRIGVSQLEEYFEDIFISDELGAKKPDPLIFKRALERLDSPKPESVLIIGDNLVSDIMGGKQYGLKTCWYNPAQADAGQYSQYIDYHIRHLKEIPHLLGV